MSKEKDSQTSKNNSDSDSELSNLYKQMATKEPPVYLDREILDASRNAVDSKTRFRLTPFKNQNYVPLSIAAVIFLCVSVVFNVYRGNTREIFQIPDATTDDEKILINATVDETGENENNSSVYRAYDQENSIQRSAPETPVQSAEMPPRVKNEKESYESKPADIKMIWQKNESQDALSPAEDKNVNSRISDEPVQNKKIMLKENKSLLKQESETEYKAFDSSEITPETSLIFIKNLWNAGKFDQARIEFDKFKLEYPDYDVEKLKEILPLELHNYLLK